MKQLVGMAIGFGSSVIVYLVHLGTARDNDAVCGLTSHQHAVAHSMFMSFNSSCSWNLTVTPSGVNVN